MIKSKVRTKVIFVATVLLFSLCLMLITTEDNYATKNVTATQEKIVSIRDRNIGKYSCTNFAAIAFSGKTLYGIKTHVNDKVCALYKISNFSNPKRKVSMTSIKLRGKAANIGHANGMEVYKNALFIATAKEPGKGSQILKVSSAGNIKKRYSLNKTIYSITYFRAGTFILGGGIGHVDGRDYRRYYVAKYKNGKFDIQKTFYIKSDLTGQDIHSRKGYLYAIVFDDKNGGRVRSNYIHIINLKKPVKDKKVYPISKTITSKAQSSKTSMYEMEGIDFQGHRMYCSVNVTRKGCGRDGVYRIKY